MNMKKKCVGVLSGLFLLTTCIALPVSLSASAEELGSFASENLQMTEGAATRTLSPYGLKFQATFTTEEAPEGNYGMLIVPYDYFAKAEVEIAETTDYVKAFSTAYTEGKIAYEPIIVEGLQAKTGENGLCIEHSIVELREGNFDRPFFGVAFEKVGEGYQYAPFNNNVRSIMQVASAALNKHHTTTGGKYGEAELSELNKFVSTGISNAHGNGFVYAISGDGATGVGYTTALSVNTGLIANWSSNNEEVATVDKNGVVTGVSEGTATITAENYIGGEKKTATLEVTVNEAQTSTLTFADLGMADGAAFASHSVQDINFEITGGKYVAKDSICKFYKNANLAIEANAGYQIAEVIVSMTGNLTDIKDYPVEGGVATKGDKSLIVKANAGVNAISIENSEGVRDVLSITVKYIPNGEATATVEEKTLTELSAMEAYSGSYQVTGTITALDGATGAMTITDGTTSVEVLNSFNEDGSLHYSRMTEKPVVGNEVTLIVAPNKTESGFKISSARIQSYREVQVSEAMKISITKAEIEGLQIEEDTVTVPVKGTQYEDIAIVWTSSNEAVLSVNNETGAVMVNKPTDADVTVTLTAKVGTDNEGVTFDIIVYKVETVGQEFVLEDVVTDDYFGASSASIVAAGQKLGETVIGVATMSGNRAKYNTSKSGYVAIYKIKDSKACYLEISCDEGYQITKIEFTTENVINETFCSIDGANSVGATDTKNIILTANNGGVQSIKITNNSSDTQINILTMKITYKKI